MKVFRFRTYAKHSILIAATLVTTIAVPQLNAQAGEKDLGEVSAFGGGVFGLGNSHPAVGAGTGVAVTRYGMALIEAAFSPLGDDTVRRRIGPSAENSRLYDFNASMHIRIPVRGRWEPYGILGGGLLFSSFRTVSDGSGSAPAGAVLSRDEFNFGFHTGAGLRYYVGQNWGVRPELRVILSNVTYTRFTVGVFYKLPAGWP